MHDRTSRGWEQLNALDGEAGRAIMESLADIAPDLGRLVIEAGFGEIYARAGLVPRDRQLVTIGALAAMGGCEPQLRFHIGAALNVGLTPTEVVEAIIHVVAYAGFPRALNAMEVAKEVFGERGLLPIDDDAPLR